MYSINVFGCVIIEKHFAVDQMYRHITSSVHCSDVQYIGVDIYAYFVHTNVTE